MDRKGVEGLPLKYVVIVLVAVLVISMVLEMVGVLKGGIMHIIFNMNETLTNATI